MLFMTSQTPINWGSRVFHAGPLKTWTKSELWHEAPLMYIFSYGTECQMPIWGPQWGLQISLNLKLSFL